MADTYTPVSVYLRLRDVFPQSLLLECSDYSSPQNAFSYITLAPLAGITATFSHLETRLPEGESLKNTLQNPQSLAQEVDDFLQKLKSYFPSSSALPAVFGFTAYDAINCFDTVSIRQNPDPSFPLLRYDLYQVVIIFDHFHDRMEIQEIIHPQRPQLTEKIGSILANRNATTYPFTCLGQERINTSDAVFMKNVEQARQHCARGDVFQMVLSRRYEQDFAGDEFNVYRALRSINPSPYLFYFDLLDFKLFGSSPEAQLRVNQGKAIIHPIAGTVVRSGCNTQDQQLIQELLKNPKEHAEHAMLVDLARNDLSRHAQKVEVEQYRQVQTFSHVIHLVSQVCGQIPASQNRFQLFADTFPAGTLSGAPKYRAVQLIDLLETSPRGFYGGAVGMIGLDGSLNHAIMIRSFFSCSGTLAYQSGAGVVIESTPQGELQEVEGKIAALRKAINQATKLSPNGMQETHAFTLS